MTGGLTSASSPGEMRSAIGAALRDSDFVLPRSNQLFTRTPAPGSTAACRSTPMFCRRQLETLNVEASIA
jgi:hypothetical protein